MYVSKIPQLTSSEKARSHVQNNSSIQNKPDNQTLGQRGREEISGANCLDKQIVKTEIKFIP